MDKMIENVRRIGGLIPAYWVGIVFLFCICSCEIRNNEDVADPGLLRSSAPEQPIDVSDVPLAVENVGVFPYLPSPEGYVYSDQAKNMNFAEIYRFYRDSSIVSIGGKYYRTTISKARFNRGVFSDSVIVEYYDRAITRLGGKEIYIGDKPLKMIDLLDDEESRRPVAGNYRQYIIRTPHGNIWFELNTKYGNMEQAMFSVVSEIESREPAWFMKAERMRDAIERNNRVVLYVNFDRNNASLKPDGVAVVEEIAQLMRLDRNLRLSVEGHIDNIGTPEFNKRLSSERARAIVLKLKEIKVQNYRLKSYGAGAEHLLVASNADENRSMNRRIELVKTNVDESGLKEAIDKDGKAVLHIMFDSGKSTLKPEEIEIVDEIAKLMQSDKKLKLSIEGHTDNVGSAELNETLSFERARTIVRKLEEMKINPNRLRIAGYGSRKPLVPNTSDENRAKNRRVEIVKFS